MAGSSRGGPPAAAPQSGARAEMDASPLATLLGFGASATLLVRKRRFGEQTTWPRIIG